MPTTAAAAPLALHGFRPFMRFWFARLAGTMGDRMPMLAVGWQMHGLTGSACLVGASTVYALCALLFFTAALLFVGVRHAPVSVGSVVLGGLGTLLIAGPWMKLFPDLACRETLRSAPPRACTPTTAAP